MKTLGFAVVIKRGQPGDLQHLPTFPNAIMEKGTYEHHLACSFLIRHFFRTDMKIGVRGRCYFCSNSMVSHWKGADINHPVGPRKEALHT